jgi:ParB/RepB/Spo0J family partition protein
MSSKSSDRIKALQERAAALASREKTKQQDTPDAQHSDIDVTAASTHFGAAIDHLIRNREIYRIPVRQIAPDTRAAMRQPRHLPLPQELMHQGEPLPAYHRLVSELLSLGESLKEKQIQPIIVFPGPGEISPDVRYLILVGHRRWTAAYLVGLDHIDAVVVDPPDPAERVLIQYAENEARAEFSDMERAWSLQQMKQVLGDAPWEDVETRLHMSRARRQQLLRLLAFTPEQQKRVALLRLQETQARPLHSAVRSGELQPDQVEHILSRLTRIASDRALALMQQTSKAADKDEENEEEDEKSIPRSPGIDSPTVARLVAQARREFTRTTTALPTPRWFPPLRDQFERMGRSLRRTRDRVETLNDADRQTLHENIQQLQSLLHAVEEKIEQLHSATESETMDEK